MQLGEDSQIRRHDTIARDDSRHGLQTQPNVVFYKCPHFLFLITTYAVISCPIHHHEGPHHIAAKRCAPQNIPAHLFIFFHYFSSSCLSSLCLSVCAHVSQCSVHTVYKCAHLVAKVLSHPKLCVCVCLSASIPFVCISGVCFGVCVCVRVCLTAYPWVSP